MLSLFCLFLCCCCKQKCWNVDHVSRVVFCGYWSFYRSIYKLKTKRLMKSRSNNFKQNRTCMRCICCFVLLFIFVFVFTHTKKFNDNKWICRFFQLFSFPYASKIHSSSTESNLDNFSTTKKKKYLHNTIWLNCCLKRKRCSFFQMFFLFDFRLFFLFTIHIPLLLAKCCVWESVAAFYRDINPHYVDIFHALYLYQSKMFLITVNNTQRSIMNKKRLLCV